MNEQERFLKKRKEMIDIMGQKGLLEKKGVKFINDTLKYQYSYNFFWLGRPIIQYPQDIVAIQEIIWEVKPDLIVETGIAHGGSLMLSASMITILEAAKQIDKGMVLGIDIDIRQHNRKEIEKHPLYNKIKMIEGSSVSEETINMVHSFAKDYKNIMLFLDSNHTHNHVLAELKAYATLVTKGSYCVVFDTIIEDLPEATFPDRPWGKGNNPKTAVYEFLNKHPEFNIDKTIQNKLLITTAPDGYLKRIK